MYRVYLTSYLQYKRFEQQQQTGWIAIIESKNNNNKSIISYEKWLSCECGTRQHKRAAYEGNTYLFIV